MTLAVSTYTCGDVARRHMLPHNPCTSYIVYVFDLRLAKPRKLKHKKGVPYFMFDASTMFQVGTLRYLYNTIRRCWMRAYL
jgi:hypothetical protein